MDEWLYSDNLFVSIGSYILMLILITAIFGFAGLTVMKWMEVIELIRKRQKKNI